MRDLYLILAVYRANDLTPPTWITSAIIQKAIEQGQKILYNAEYRHEESTDDPNVRDLLKQLTV